MNQDSSPRGNENAIKRSLRAISVGSYVFQSGVAARLGLNATDLEAVYRIGTSEAGLSAGELASQLGLTSGATTAVIDRLVRAGFVVRDRDERDGRRVRVRLDPGGSARLGKEYAEIDRRVELAIEALEPGERAVVAGFLRAISG